MKIVFTVATYWPKTDGVQMVTQYQAEGLAKLGHEIIVITSLFEGLLNEEKHNNINIIRVNASNFYYWHKGKKKDFRHTVIRCTQNADALISVCLQSYSADWILGIIDKIYCKKILYMHGMPDFKLNNIKQENLIQGLKVIVRTIRWKYFYKVHFHQIKKFDSVIHLFNNDNSHVFFKRKGYFKNIIIENAAEEIFFNNNIKKTDNLYKKYFINIGNYCSRKNQLLCLNSFYKSETKDFSLIFIGSEKNNYCEHLISKKRKLDVKYGKKDVKILYGVLREEIYSYIANAYSFILSSYNEFFPITIIEAMTCGVPFISTNVGIMKYLPFGAIAHKHDDIKYWIEFFVENEELIKNSKNIIEKYAYKKYNHKIQVKKLENLIWSLNNE